MIFLKENRERKLFSAAATGSCALGAGNFNSLYTSAMFKHRGWEAVLNCPMFEHKVPYLRLHLQIPAQCLLPVINEWLNRSQFSFTEFWGPPVSALTCKELKGPYFHPYNKKKRGISLVNYLSWTHKRIEVQRKLPLPHQICRDRKIQRITTRIRLPETEAPGASSCWKPLSGNFDKPLEVECAPVWEWETAGACSLKGEPRIFMSFTSRKPIRFSCWKAEIKSSCFW